MIFGICLGAYFGPNFISLASKASWDWRLIHKYLQKSSLWSKPDPMASWPLNSLTQYIKIFESKLTNMRQLKQYFPQENLEIISWILLNLEGALKILIKQVCSLFWWSAKVLDEMFGCRNYISKAIFSVCIIYSIVS